MAKLTSSLVIGFIFIALGIGGLISAYEGTAELVSQSGEVRTSRCEARRYQGRIVYFSAQVDNTHEIEHHSYTTNNDSCASLEALFTKGVAVEYSYIAGAGSLVELKVNGVSIVERSRRNLSIALSSIAVVVFGISIGAAAMISFFKRGRSSKV